VQLEQLVYEALTQGSPQTDAGDRVYAILAPENSQLPRLTYTRVSTTPFNSLGGHAGVDQVTIQIDCWARTNLGCVTLARQVRKAMEGQPFKATPTSQNDGMETESKIYRHTVEFNCWDKSF
jgi:hypothetical protein